MILAAIIPAREAALRQLLASMNDAPGRVNVNNALIPFVQFDTLHFARLLILDDKTTEDVRIYGLPTREYPLYLAFLGDIDGAEKTFLNELARRAPDGLRAIFSCCEGFTADADLVDWMTQHRSSAIANYVNARGRTVRQIREEAALREALEAHLASHAFALEGLRAREIHAELSQFINAEKSAGRLTLSDERATPVGWWIANMLHLIGIPLLLLLALPLLIVAAPFYLIRLRHLEKTDPEHCPAVDQTYSDALVRPQHHPRPATRGGIIDSAVLVGREVADVNGVDRPNPFRQRAPCE